MTSSRGLLETFSINAFMSRPACWTFSSSSETFDLSAVSLTAASALWAYFLNRPMMDVMDRLYSGFSWADLMTYQSMSASTRHP